MNLSIVIACCNASFGKDAELWPTLRSIQQTTAGMDEVVEVILVDDCSATPVPDFTGCRVIRNHRPLGIGASRHIGALHATGDYILLCDVHMAFTPDWYLQAMRRLDSRPRTLHCATCLGLSSSNMDVNHPDAVYHGATLNVYGPDPHNRGVTQTMEVVWQHKIHEDDAELPAIMGATYFWPRRWFLELEPLRFLRGYGSDELMMSLKAWLSGGDIRLMTGVRIGHKFRLKGERQPSLWPESYMSGNKLFAIRTLLPEDLAKRVENLLRPSQATLAWAKENAGLIETERARNKTLFRRDIYWYASKFGIPLP